jgi:CheY-like chemotaxis protein
VRLLIAECSTEILAGGNNFQHINEALHSVQFSHIRKSLASHVSKYFQWNEEPLEPQGVSSREAVQMSDEFNAVSEIPLGVSNALYADPLLAKLRKQTGDGLMLGGVLLKSKLGEGGTGAVYLGWHTRLSCPVAVKVLKDASAQNLPMFLREARLTVAIDHPNLVRVFDVNVDNSTKIYYMVMEYIEGLSAYQHYERQHALTNRGLDPVEALEIGLATARAIGAAHGAGIVHRDVKSDNILIRKKDHTVKVTDLGFAGTWQKNPQNIRHSTVAGTLGFLSPEALRGEEVTPAADVYGVGATLFEILTGHLPYGHPYDDTYYDRQFAGEAPDIRQYIPDIDPAVSKLIQRCLRVDPKRRYVDGNELAVALETVLAKLPGSSKVGVPAGEADDEGRAPCVLCVDDDEDVLELMRDVFSLNGYQPVCFRSGIEALAHLDRMRPSVAVLDLNMPGMNGIELCQRLRQQPGYSELGVLILSGADAPEIIEHALKKGITDYLVKPMKPSELLLRVKLLSKLRAMNDERSAIEVQLRKLKQSSSSMMVAARPASAAYGIA